MKTRRQTDRVLAASEQSDRQHASARAVQARPRHPRHISCSLGLALPRRAAGPVMVQALRSGSTVHHRQPRGLLRPIVTWCHVRPHSLPRLVLRRWQGRLSPRLRRGLARIVLLPLLLCALGIGGTLPVVQ